MQNYSECILFWEKGSGFLHLYNYVEIHPCRSLYQQLVYLIAVQYASVSRYHSSLIYYPLMDFQVVSSFQLLQIKCYEHFCTDFFVNISFLFPRINAQQYNSRSYGSCMLSFIRHCQTIFESGYTILRSHQQNISDPVSPYPCQHLVLPLFFSLIILIVYGDISTWFQFEFP